MFASQCVHVFLTSIEGMAPQQLETRPVIEYFVEFYLRSSPPRENSSCLPEKHSVTNFPINHFYLSPSEEFLFSGESDVTCGTFGRFSLFTSVSNNQSLMQS